MDISQVTSGASTQAPSTSEQAASVLSSDFETFLQMLTAQARYQDPLEPIDSSEYAAQLAQFSMVEQQVLSNDLLGQLAALMGTSGVGQAAAWIGMDARTTAAVPSNGDAITVHPEPDKTAEQAFLLAYDADGTLVQRQEIPVTAEAIDWRPDAAQSASTRQTYRFEVESVTAGDVIGVSQAETYARITEVRSSASGTEVILDGGSSVTADGISALREASAVPPDEI